MKKEIGRRLQDWVVLGCDFPVLMYEKAIEDWGALGYAAEVLDKILRRNAERFFGVQG